MSKTHTKMFNNTKPSLENCHEKKMTQGQNVHKCCSSSNVWLDLISVGLLYRNTLPHTLLNIP